MEKSIDLGVFSAKASLLFAFLLMAMVVASVSTASEPVGECTETLMAISPCLPYISSPPNNLSSSASILCCESFSAAADSGNATCLCYLLRQPFIFGFPLNNTRISSLFFVCPLGSDMNSGTRTPLESLCKVSKNSPSPMPILVPLAVPTLAPAPVPTISASHVPSLPQNHAESSPTPMSPSADMGTDSSTSESDSSSSSSSSCSSCHFLPGMLFSIHIFVYL